VNNALKKILLASALVAKIKGICNMSIRVFGGNVFVQSKQQKFRIWSNVRVNFFIKIKKKNFFFTNIIKSLI
jgi:hypothetical protein